MKKSVLVTGGCGFIGSNLCRALYKKGYIVDIVDHANEIDEDLFLIDGSVAVRTCPSPLLPALKKKDREGLMLLVNCDFADDNIIRKIESKKYDIVFHMAAEPRVGLSVEDPVFTCEENLFKTVRLFKACADSSTKVIFSSSSAVYGDSDSLPTPEDSSKNPQSPYALQKLHAEDYAKLFNSLYGLDIVCLRYFNVFGPGGYGDSPYATAIAAWCHAVANELPLRSDGDGEQTRDMVYVDDVVRINIMMSKFSEKFKGDCYNVSTGTSISNNEILQMFMEKFENLQVNHAPERVGDVKHTLGDNKKLIDLCGFEASSDFGKNLQKTWDWWGFN